MFYAAFSLEFCVWLQTLVFDEAGLVGIQGEPAIIVLICSFPIWHKFHFFFFWRASSRILCLSLWFLGVCQENDKRKCKRSETQVQNGQKQGKGAQIKKLATSIFKIIFSGACGLMSTGHNDLCDLMIATWYFQHQPVRLLGSGWYWLDNHVCLLVLITWFGGRGQ